MALPPLRRITPLPRDVQQVRVTLETSVGTAWCRLFPDKAPLTVANFVHLAQGSQPWSDANGREQRDVPYYDGRVFHRVVPGFIVQGGCVRGDGLGNPGYRFADELSARHDRPGILSMANAGRDTNGAQFFVTLRAAPELDRRHSVFGVVEHGLEVFTAIAQLPRRGERPLEDVTIERVSVELMS